MKIAFFSNSYLPYISGVTVTVATLTKYLRKAGHEVYLFVPSYPGHHETSPHIFRLPSLPSTYPGFRLTVPWIADPKALKILKEANVIHSHTPFGLGLLAMFFANTYKKPFVYSFHTLFKHYLHHVPLLPEKAGEFILSRYLGFFCNHCRMILAPSKKMKEYLRGDGVTANVEILPGGIDFERASDLDPGKTREKLGLKPSDQVLIFSGRLTKEKNIKFILEAFQVIRQKQENTFLVIVGSGPGESALKDLAKQLGIAANVIFAGRQSHTEIFNYYAAGDLFVFGSKTETQGLVISEAKAVGLPVVVVDEAGVSNSVVDGEDGFLVPEDKNIFADKCLEILLNPELKDKMSESARLNAEKDFSAEKVADDLVEIYSSLR